MSVAVSSPLPSPSFDGMAVAAEERYIGSVLSDNERSGDSSPTSADDNNISVSLFSSSADVPPPPPPPTTASSILATLRGVNGTASSSSSAAVSRPLSPHTASTDSEHSASSVLSYPSWLRGQGISVFDVLDDVDEPSLPLHRANSSPSLQRAISPPAYSPTASTLSSFSSSPHSTNSAVLRPLTHSPPTEIEYLTARLEQLQASEQHNERTAAKQQWHDERGKLRSIGSVPDMLHMASVDGYLPTRSQSGVLDSLSSSPPTPRYGRSSAYQQQQPLSNSSHSRDVSYGPMDGHRRSTAPSEHRLRSSSTTFKPYSHAQSYLPNGTRRTSIPDEQPPTRFSPSTASTVSSSCSVSPHSANSTMDESRQRPIPPTSHISPLSSPSLFSQQFASLPLSAIVSRGLLIDLCTDQYGSRFIQQKLEVCTDEERDLAFHAITAADNPTTDGSQLVVSLSLDVFANYTVQKLMEVCTAAQQRTLCLSLVGSVLLLALQTYGCRVVQKAMEVATVDVQSLLVSEIEGHAMSLMTDQNGNHVVQKCIECCPAALLDPLLQSVRSHIYRLASHPYGCRVTQRMLEHGSASQRQLIMDEIVSADGNYALLDLMRSSFGNYVAQGTMVHGSNWHRRRLCDAIKGHVAALSRHKFASNVMEKCLIHADKADQQSLINEIMGEPNSAASSLSLPFLDLCSDPYGNYVLQRLLNVIEEEQRIDLLWRLKRFVPHLKKIPYGKHILARIERMSFAAISGAAATSATSSPVAGRGAGMAMVGGVMEPMDGNGSRVSDKAAAMPSGGGRITPQYPPGFHHFPQHSHSPTRGTVGGGGGGGSRLLQQSGSPMSQPWDSAWALSQQHADNGSSTRFVPFNR